MDTAQRSAPRRSPDSDETGVFAPTPRRKPIGENCAQSAETVDDRPAKSNGGRVVAIAHGDGNVSELEAESNRLDQHFLIKCEVVGVRMKRNAFEKFSRVRPVATMEIPN